MPEITIGMQMYAVPAVRCSMVASKTGAAVWKESILARAATAEVTEVFHALVERYGRLLRSAIRKTCPANRPLPLDDIEQEAKIKIWKALHRGISIANPKSYLYRVAVNTTLDALRRVQARPEQSFGGTAGDQLGLKKGDVVDGARVAHDPEQLAITNDLLDHVRSCMTDLGDNRRRSVGLYLQGFTTREIGELMGWSEAKARNLTYRGINALRAQLRTKGIEYEDP